MEKRVVKASMQGGNLIAHYTSTIRYYSFSNILLQKQYIYLIFH